MTLEAYEALKNHFATAPFAIDPLIVEGSRAVKDAIIRAVDQDFSDYDEKTRLTLQAELGKWEDRAWALWRSEDESTGCPACGTNGNHYCPAD